MRHLNYTHLLYFWTVATEGSVTAAAESLSLTPQTVSGQIKLLEDTIGEALFYRQGRGLALTETGEVVRQYADEMFSLGAELTHRVRSKQTLVSSSLNVGIVDSIPKLIALRVLEPVLSLRENIRVVCQEDSLDNLVSRLAVHRLDLVISDRSLPAGLGVKAYNHSLGESGISLFAHESIADRYTTGFPESLNDAPILLPVDGPMRRGVEAWCDRSQVRPRIIGEFSDSALLKAFGEAGHGIFPAPTAIRAEVSSMYHSVCLGQIEASERYYAISPERKIRHPAVLAVTESARGGLFA